MIKAGLRWIHIIFMGFIALFLLLSIFYVIIRPGHIAIPQVKEIRHPLPKRYFEQTEEAYESIGNGFTELKFALPSAQLPDLRKKIIYYGKNSRPDADENETLMHFDFLGGKDPVSVKPGEKLFITFDPSLKPTGYAFSPENQETYLWLVARPNLKGAIVSLIMRGENGEEIKTPEKHSEFTLPEKEYNRFSGGTWALGKWRVDGSLFARQHARWYGKDRFLDLYGGDEYAHIFGKERIDFGEGGDAYSVFVAEGDALVWNHDRWEEVVPGPDSFGKPLLVVKKVEDRLINCELWDVEGKAKIHLNLLKCIEAWIPNHLEKSFKFVGAHTRSQFAFEINRARVVLSPDDWFVYAKGNWIKLETADEIDQYVQRKLIGPLFVFEGIGQKDDQQVLVGKIINSSRTEVKDVEIPATQNTVKPSVSKKAIVSDIDEDYDDEDYDDDDEDYDDDDYPDAAYFGPPEECFD